MAYENVTLEREGAVAILTVNRPKALNALNKGTFDDIDNAADEVEGDPSIRVLIVTGAGDKAFVAGADITEFEALEGANGWFDLSTRGQSVFEKLERMNKPVIAAINGFCLGGGLELALGCDIRFAADTAKMGVPEINLGLIPGYGATQRMARLMSKGMAKKLVFTGDMIGAEEAYGIGLVDQVVPAAELMETVRKFASKLAAKAPIALKLAKLTVNEAYETDITRGMTIEATNFALAGSTEDATEGAKAFLEKRKPEFKGK